MSDPSSGSGPYECHGPMAAMAIPSIDELVAFYYCHTCGVWRHAFRRADARRIAVELYIAQSQIVPKMAVKR